MTRKRARSQSTETRERILKAAAELIAQKGFAATTTREIGDRASMLSGSLYYYFETKERMALDIVEIYFTDLKAGYDAVLREEIGPAARLRRLIEVSLEVSSRRPNEVTILYQDWLALNSVDGSLDQWMDRIEQLWIDVINDGISSFEFRQDLDSRLVFRTIMGAISWVPRWFRLGGASEMTQVARVQAEIMLSGLSMQDQPPT